MRIDGPHGVREVRVSNPNKIYFPARAITKREVVEYYLAVAEPLLRAIGDRPTTLKRFPDGVDGDPFYAKRLPNGTPSWIESVWVTFPSGRGAHQFRPSEPAALAWAANLGTLDFHPWPVTAADVDHPDEMRLDLDPQPGTDFGDAARVAGVLREVLDEIGMACFPKTSGGRGIHVVVPIRPMWDFIEVRRAVIALAREVQRRIPDLATVEWWKVDRGERVFVDFNQAARDRTIASAWSVRGNPNATVSMPLDWHELDQVDPDDFDVRSAPRRLSEVGDSHLRMHERAFGLEQLLEWFERDLREHGIGELPYPPDYPKMPGEPRRSRVRPTTDKGV